MTIRLYDTATRELRDLDPVVPGRVGIYHCGLTVQGPPHIGHIRKEVVFDVLRRWLERADYEVTIVANLTDIDDKVLAKGEEQGRPWYEVAYENERALHAAYEVLGCIPPSYEPRATGHVPEMVEMIGTLVERGHAYVAEDGSGDVYFDVRSWPSYGELSNQRIDDMQAAEDAPPEGKRDVRDFALWKGHKPGEPDTASWPTPWGRGRPGWHLECSAMAGKYLGDEFDIHGGGLDLRFPHHENELAQSRAAGQAFARVWMHNAMLNLGGSKMAKSVGNTLAGERGRQARRADRPALLPRGGALPLDRRVQRGGARRGGHRVRTHRGIRRAGHRADRRRRRRHGHPERRVRRGDGRRPLHTGGAGRDPGRHRRWQQAPGRRRLGSTAWRPGVGALDARRARHRPTGRAVDGQPVVAPTRRSTRSSRRSSRSARRPAPARTSRRPIASATSSRPPASRSRTPRRVRGGA